MQAEQPVRSRSHPLVKRLRALRERADSEGGLMLLEGPRLVLEALRSGVELVEAAASARAAARCAFSTSWPVATMPRWASRQTGAGAAALERLCVALTEAQLTNQSERAAAALDGFAASLEAL